MSDAVENPETTRAWIAKRVISVALVLLGGYGLYCTCIGDATGLRYVGGCAAVAVLVILKHYFPGGRAGKS